MNSSPFEFSQSIKKRCLSALWDIGAANFHRLKLWNKIKGLTGSRYDLAKLDLLH